MGLALLGQPYVGLGQPWLGVLGMKSAARPPVDDAHTARILGWLGDLIDHASLLVLDGDDDDREGFLAKLAVARLIEIQAAELQKRFADKAQELGASYASLAHATGLREQTVTKKHRNRHRTEASAAPAGATGWRKRR